LEKLEVPFDLYVVPGSLCHVATIAEKFPKLKMVIDHIGKPKVQVRKWLMFLFKILK
jgi:predicted TIM-barrel fold metal-dependent hydrolase